jgi:nucleotide-binding universal stress UspA family protein
MSATFTSGLVKAGRRSTFARVLVGIDGSPESAEAARQAAVLADDGPLTLLSAYDLVPPVVSGLGLHVPPVCDAVELQDAALTRVEHARDELGDTVPECRCRITCGRASSRLIEEVLRRQHTLVAVGSHGTGRIHGILIGSTATEVVHKAPSSVLVARAAGATFPARIVVGVDGSPESATAFELARELATRFGASVWPVVAHGGKGVDEGMVETILGDYREDSPDAPVRALVAAAADADLVIVGSRGLHGVRSLGSVSERVAHEASCSVLVARAPVAVRSALS